jgi:hypothetical protein
LTGLALLAGTSLTLLPRAPSRITAENVERIREGMSLAEVDAILGPYGDYTSGPVLPLDDGSCVDVSGMSYNESVDTPGRRSDGSLSNAGWACDSGYAEVFFDRHSRVTDAWFQPYGRMPQTPLENLLWRCERRWRRWFPE